MILSLISLAKYDLDPGEEIFEKSANEFPLGFEASVCVCLCVLVTQLCLTLCDPWIVADQALLCVVFSGQEYQSGLPFPSPGDLPIPGIKPELPAL